MPEINVSFTCTPDEAQMLAALYAALTGDIGDGVICNVDALPKALLAIQENLLADFTGASGKDMDEVGNLWATANWSINDRAFLDGFLELDDNKLLDAYINRSMDESDDDDDDGLDPPFPPVVFLGFCPN